MAIAIRTFLPTENNDRPPVVLVHGAANSAAVWTFWQHELAGRGWPTHAIDLRGHGESSQIDLAHTSMGDYADDVHALAHRLRDRPIVMGWSMGGLVAMMAAASGDYAACVALAPSTPARQIDESVELRTGDFGPEEYGLTGVPEQDARAMPDVDPEDRAIGFGSLGCESRMARDERRRGVVIESMPCPLLIVTGSEDRQWPRERYDDLWLPAEHVSVEGASHWGLVLNKRALSRSVPAVTNWLERVGTGR